MLLVGCALWAGGCRGAPPPATEPRSSGRDARLHLPDGVGGDPGWLGVELRDGDAGRGVTVVKVLRGSPADLAGIEAGDEIVQVGELRVGSPAALRETIAAHRAGERLPIALLRRGATRLFAVELAARPDLETMIAQNVLGAPAPPLPVKAVTGLTPDRQLLAGKVVLVEFWAEWCLPCHLLSPRLNAWRDRFRGEGVEIIGVTAERVETAARAARELGIEYTVAADDTGEATTLWGAHALPSLFVVDRQGIVRDVLVGYDEAHLARIEQLVTQLVR